MSLNHRSERAEYIARGWLRDEPAPAFPRLAFPREESTQFVTPRNREQIQHVLSEMKSSGIQTRRVDCCLGGSDDITVAEVDRYGIPLRTVIDRNTGLMRSDPYYDDDYLRVFYEKHYRTIYQMADHDPVRFLANQILSGQKAYETSRPFLPESARVLDIGCGMGGFLVAFKIRGHHCVGCDFGGEYLEFGRKLGLDLRQGGMETAAEAGPFDLLILSHVLEHQVNAIDFLRSAGALLKPDGLILVSVPGIESIDDGYSCRLDHYLQNAHVWHFTKQTLTAVLARSGFEMLAADDTVQCLARWKGRPLEWTLPQGYGEAVLEFLRKMERVRKKRTRRSALRQGIKRLARQFGMGGLAVPKI